MMCDTIGLDTMCGGLAGVVVVAVPLDGLAAVVRMCLVGDGTTSARTSCTCCYWVDN